MFLPFAYAIGALWVSLFNPQIIEAIPVGDHITKGVVYGIAVVLVWCMLALKGLETGGIYD